MLLWISGVIAAAGAIVGALISSSGNDATSSGALNANSPEGQALVADIQATLGDPNYYDVQLNSGATVQAPAWGGPGRMTRGQVNAALALLGRNVPSSQGNTFNEALGAGISSGSQSIAEAMAGNSSDLGGMATGSAAQPAGGSATVSAAVPQGFSDAVQTTDTPDLSRGLQSRAAQPVQPPAEEDELAGVLRALLRQRGGIGNA